MLFNSLTFVVFFAVVLIGYWALRSNRLRKGWLLVASYVFYGAWSPPFVLLLLFSTVVDFWAARRMAASESPGNRRLWLGVSLVANLGLLGYFKYGGFLLENFAVAAGWVGVTFVPPESNIILPVGISFYTFQTLSYTIDVYRRQLRPWPSFLDFALFVSFFPQLVAGPIVRAADFLPQTQKTHVWDQARFFWGLFLVTLGLFQKTVLADTLLSGTAEQVFAHSGPLATLDAWVGVLAFSGQIFFDFAGYSTCAIGAALCLGYVLPKNFRFPYAAVGFSDFWRRWHISLSTWLRDYLYIPLGGNRRGSMRSLSNLMIVMLLGGLWHGAAWTFVIWGALHGAYLVVERLLKKCIPRGPWMERVPVRLVFILVTYIFVCFAWVFFRASSFPQAMGIVRSMAFLPGAGATILPTLDIVIVGAVTVLLLLVHYLMRNTSIEAVASRTPGWLLALVWAVMGYFAIINQGTGNAFIYFQF